VKLISEHIRIRLPLDIDRRLLNLTNDKSQPKAERKRLQVENAPKKSVRAQTIKLAD